MKECPERLLGDDDALAPRTARERALADIELEPAKLVHLNEPVTHGGRRRNKKGMRTSRNCSLGGAILSPPETDHGGRTREL